MITATYTYDRSCDALGFPVSATALGMTGKRVEIIGPDAGGNGYIVRSLDDSHYTLAYRSELFDWEES